MAKIPTDEEMGLQILKVWEERNLRAGDSLGGAFIEGLPGRKGWRMEDFARGIKRLTEHGYLVLDDRAYRLSQAGFAFLCETD